MLRLHLPLVVFGLVLAFSGAPDGALAQDVAPVEDDEAMEEGSGLDVAVASEASRGDADGGEVMPERRVAVLLLGTTGVDPETAEALSEVVLGAVAVRQRVTLVGQAELASQLERDSAALLDCISMATCMGRLGVQLALDEVFAGTVGLRGDDEWVFDLSRIEVSTGETVARAHHELTGDVGAVADGLLAAVGELFTARPEPAPEAPPPVVEPPSEPVPPARSTLVLRSRTGAEVALDGALVGTTRAEGLTLRDLEPGRYRLSVQADGAVPWERTVALVAGATARIAVELQDLPEPALNPLTWIFGSVAVTVATLGAVLGVRSQQPLDLALERRANGTVTRAEAVAFYAERDREAIAANVLFALSGAALVGFAVALFFPVERTPNPPERTETEPRVP